MIFINKINPAVQVSIGLVLLTASILISALTLGLLPNKNEHNIESRIHLSQNIALQTTLALKNQNAFMVDTLFDQTVKHNLSIASIAIRDNAGKLTFSTKDHESTWELSITEKSNPNFIRIPLIGESDSNALLEISYIDLSKDNNFIFGIPQFIAFMIFVCATGFLAFWLYLKRVLKHLDPSAIIPERVRNAFNIMAEGVLIMDKRETIVLANEAFSRQLKITENDLIGKKMSTIPWTKKENDISGSPWEKSIRRNDRISNETLVVKIDEKNKIFSVNCVPIIDDAGNIKGAITSFDDITDRERKERVLNHLLKDLGEKNDSIETKNKELKFLASHDPMTGCLNRRALMEVMDTIFVKNDLRPDVHCVVMLDIDKFKNINDTYGHQVGDEIIIGMANELKKTLRKTDTLARMGGEEFFIVLPNTSLVQAEQTVEKCRLALEKLEISGVKFTASFGISSTNLEAESVAELIQQSDHALYHSKNNGRNQTTIWSLDIDEESVAPNAIPKENDADLLPNMPN